VLRFRPRAHSPTHAIAFRKKALDGVQRDVSVRAYDIIYLSSDVESKVIGHMSSPLTRTSALLLGETPGMLGVSENQCREDVGRVRGER
jgi:hypothetical protein